MASATDTDNDGIPDLFVDCADASGTICTPLVDSLVTVAWEGLSLPTGTETVMMQVAIS